MRNPERRTTLVRELEPAVSDFLDYLASELKKEPELSDLNDSRTFEQLASDLKAIRYKLGAEQATPGTRRDYLHWLIERNLYLDPRGTFQTQRQVQVKLNEVYISLRAQRDKAPGEVDRRLLEQEKEQLEEKIARSYLSAEEIEDQQEHLMARIESRLTEPKNAPGEIVELTDAVERHERLVILGDPGSGKSTLLRYLALKYAQELYEGRSEAVSDLGTARFPILIRIADYAEHGMPKGKTLSSYLVDYYDMHECPKFGLHDLLATELAVGNWLHENKPTGIATEQEVYRELGQEWVRIKGQDWDEDNRDIENEIKKFLLAVREHTGLFVERAPKRYGFMHLTFEEYYAARYLVARSRDRAKLIREHLHKPRWEEPILLALGFVGLDSPDDATDLLETAILAEGEEAKELKFTPSQYEDLMGRDYLFALRCLGDNIPARPKVLKKLVKRLADELFYQKGSAKFSRYRQALNEKLEYLNGSEGALALNPYLINSLRDAGARVRYYAAASLGQLAQPSPEIIKVLLEGLNQALNQSVRRDSARLLGQIDQNDEQTIQALWEGLLDRDNDVRTACTQALAQLGRRFPHVAETIERKLLLAIEDPKFDKLDSIIGRSAHDYAYEGLWLLIVGGELQGD